MASVAQVRANRANARKSTGPRTPEGKAVVAQNAVKHGLLAQQVVIRGEDPGEFELFRDRMVQDLDPAGSLEGLLAERVAHLGWRLRRAQRLDRAAWVTLETDHVAREASRPASLRRPRGEAQEDEEMVLARVVVEDFGDARLLERLLGYERRIENSLYRTVGELQKRKKSRETDTSGAEEDGGTGRGEAATEQREDEPRSLEETGRGRPGYKEASYGVSTNGGEVERHGSETKPIEMRDLDRGGPGGEAEETGRGRPGYEEAPYGVTTNGVETEDETRQTKPIEEVSRVKFEASREPG